MNALLDLFDVVHKCKLIDEHETEKAYTYLSNQLTDHEQDNTNNKHILNTPLIKLNIEETVICVNMKRYVENGATMKIYTREYDNKYIRPLI